MGETVIQTLLRKSSAGASLDELLHHVWMHFRKRQVQHLSVSFLHGSLHSLILGHCFGKASGVRPGLREQISSRLQSKRLRRRSFQLEDAGNTSPYFALLHAAGFQTGLTLPIAKNDQLLGTLDVFTKAPRAIPINDADELECIAALLALIYERGQLVGRSVADREVKSRLRQENEQLREVAAQAVPIPELIGGSPIWQRMLRQIERVAPTDSTVLIRGETGTGKELIARAIHRLSKRSAKPFIAVNCGAFSRELISSELFGHERGAFTGAIERRLGRFDLAHGGTLFLDEVAELPADVQVRLLRALQEREYERVGGSQVHRADVRIVAATHRDMETERAAGRFRDDLFYRLNVVPLFVPALRERREDIAELLRYFLKKSELKTGRTFESIDPGCIAACESYDWPGNVRELENLVERAAILSPGTVFGIDPLAEIAQSSGGRAFARLDDSIAEHIRQALQRTQGKIYGENGAARLLGVKPSTLQAKMLKYGIDRRLPRPTSR